MSSHRMIVVLAAFVGTLLSMASYVRAVGVHLAWDAPPTADGTTPAELAGYRLYYGWTSQLYESMVDVGNRTTYTISGLKAGQQYYFSVVAYDHSQNESPVSEEMSTIAAFGGIDSDEDGLLDADEVAAHGTDPLIADTDADGLADYDEVSFWGDAWNADADGDGIINLLDEDADNDGYSDGLEYRQGSDPGDPTSTPTSTANSWSNYRLTLTMRSDDEGATGVMFRYQGPDNYYRFSWHSDGAYGRLVKRNNGAFTLLAENAISYVPEQPTGVEIVADGAALNVSLGGVLIISAVDSDLSEGSIGLYTWFNEESSFSDIFVQDLDTEEVLAWDDFDHDDFTSWTIVDEGALMAPSSWSLIDGVILQSSKIYSELTDAADIAHSGTYAVYTR